MDIFRNLDSRGNPRSRMSKLSLKTKTNSLREALRIKTANFMTSANFKSHLPTLPNYDINIYDKAVKISAPTHLQVIKFSTFSLEKQINRHFKFNKIQIP